MKTQEVPHEIRGFHKVFEKLCYRHDYSTVFHDFLTLAVCCYAWQTEEDTYFETIKRYDKKELDLFPKLLAEWLICHSVFQEKHKDQDRSKPWFDALGTFYELLSSRGKSQALGQFFTPKPICDMIAMLNYQEGEAPETVNDPCSGSGRMLLAYDALNPGKQILYAADIDAMCVKMTALNMMIHGCKGQVWHMDSLRMEYFSGWVVNSQLEKTGLPSIIRLNDTPVVKDITPEPVVMSGRQFEINF